MWGGFESTLANLAGADIANQLKAATSQVTALFDEVEQAELKLLKGEDQAGSAEAPAAAEAAPEVDGEAEAAASAVPVQDWREGQAASPASDALEDDIETLRIQNQELTQRLRASEKARADEDLRPHLLKLKERMEALMAENKTLKETASLESESLRLSLDEAKVALDIEARARLDGERELVKMQGQLQAELESKKELDQALMRAQESEQRAKTAEADLRAELETKSKLIAELRQSTALGVTAGQVELDAAKAEVAAKAGQIANLEERLQLASVTLEEAVKRGERLELAVQETKANSPLVRTRTDENTREENIELRVQLDRSLRLAQRLITERQVRELASAETEVALRAELGTLHRRLQAVSTQTVAQQLVFAERETDLRVALDRAQRRLSQSLATLERLQQQQPPLASATSLAGPDAPAAAVRMGMSLEEEVELRVALGKVERLAKRQAREIFVLSQRVVDLDVDHRVVHTRLQRHLDAALRASAAHAEHEVDLRVSLDRVSRKFSEAVAAQQATQAELESVRLQTKALQEELERCKQQVAAAAAEHAQSAHRVQDLSAEVEAAKRASAISLAQATASLQARVEESSLQLHAVQEELVASRASLAGQLEAHKRAEDEAEARIKSITTELASCKADAEAARRDLTAATQRAQALVAEVEQAQKSMAKAQAMETQLREQSASLSRAAQQAAADADAAREALGVAQSERAALQKLVEQSKVASEQGALAQTRLLSIEMEMTKALAEADAAKTRVSALEAQLSASAAQAGQLAAHSAKFAALEADLAKQKAEAEEAKRAAREASELVEKAKTEAASAASQRVAALEVDLARIRKEAGEAKSALDAQIKTNAEATAKWTEELRAAQARASTLHNEASKAVGELEHARAALRRANEDHAALQAQLEASRSAAGFSALTGGGGAAAAAAGSAAAVAASAAAGGGTAGAVSSGGAASAGAAHTLSGSSMEDELRKQIAQLQDSIRDVKTRAKEAIKEAFKTAAKTGEGRARTASLDSLEAGTTGGERDTRPGVAQLARQLQTACVEAVTKRETAGLWRLRVIFGMIVYVGIVHGALLSVWWACRA